MAVCVLVCVCMCVCAHAFALQNGLTFLLKKLKKIYLMGIKRFLLQKEEIVP